ncbi:MAG: hypothetical protein ACKVWV_20330 [Planctomycetota bacterium]
MTQTIDYRIHVVPVVPGTKKTMNLSGDAFAIESGHHAGIVIARDEAEPDPDRDPRGDERRFHIGKFKKLRFDFTRLVPALSYQPMRVLVCTDPRMGTVQTRVDPFDVREYRMLKQTTYGAVLPVAPGEITLMSSSELQVASFVAGQTGFSSDVYLSGAVAASVDFVLIMYAIAGFQSVPIAFQRARTNPFLAAEFFVSLDVGWQTPDQLAADLVAPPAMIHKTMERMPIPVCPILLGMASLGAAGIYGASIGTVSR